MNFFRRRRKPLAAPSWIKEGDVKVLDELVAELRNHADHILQGVTTLTLTIPVVVTLNKCFQGITEGESGSDFQVVTGACSYSEKVAVLFDFVQKVLSLKIISGPISADSPLLSVAHFKALQFVEIKKIPIRFVKGLHALRRQLKGLCCVRSTESIQLVIQQFSLDADALLVLPALTDLDLSYNTVRMLDESLKYLPSLETLNLSFNCLQSADCEHLPSVSRLFLGYNGIRSIPWLPAGLSKTLTHLVLSYNNICTLEGVQVLSSLKVLDLTANCLVEFGSLSPLAHLQHLVQLSLAENPLSFFLDYRLCVVALLSPVSRSEKIILDGKPLEEYEFHHLGRDVNPVSLTTYIPEQPLGRPKGSLRALASSLDDLVNGDVSAPRMESTPVQGRSRKLRRVRHVEIQEQGATGMDSPAGSSRLSLVSLKSSNSLQKRADSMSNLFSSRRSSVDHSVVWVVQESGAGLAQAVSPSLPKLDYAAFPDEANDQRFDMSDDLSTRENSFSSNPSFDDGLAGKPSDGGIYSGEALNLRSVERQISVTRYSRNENSHRSGTPESICSGTGLLDDSITYLVERAQKDSSNVEMKDSIFLQFRFPYLLEKEPLKGEVENRLDLSYLTHICQPDANELRLALKFSLIRTDRQIREYIFDSPENLRLFFETAHPVMEANIRKKISQMHQCECLKCSNVFLKATLVDEEIRCPECTSTLVIVRDGAYDGASGGAQNQTEAEPALIVGALRPDRGVYPVVDEQNGSFGIDIPRSIGSGNASAAQSFPTKWDLRGTEGNPDNNYNRVHATSSSFPGFESHTLHASLPESTSDQISHRLEDASTVGPPNFEAGCSEPNAVLEFDSRPDVLKTLRVILSSSLSDNRRSSATPPSSSDSVRTYGSVNDSAVASQCHSRKASVSRARPPRSGMQTPVSNATRGTMLANEDEFEKCDHRLKLYLSMSVYTGDLEQFACQIRCGCVRHAKRTEFNCLLNFSTIRVYIFRILDADSDVPEDILKNVADYRLSELKCVSRGYFSQSFTLEFSKDDGLFNFLPRDSERTESFLTLISDLTHGLLAKEEVPLFADEVNPQTLANIRKYVFRMAEDPVSLGKRLYRQLTEYSLNATLLRTKKARMRTHHECFVASEFIDWLCAIREAGSRMEAVELCKNLCGAGVLLPVSKETEFSDSDVCFKFSSDHDDRKIVRGNTSTDKVHEEENSVDEGAMDVSVHVYLLAMVRINDEDSTFHPRSIFSTATHIFLVDECHQWPLPRLCLPSPKIRDQFALKQFYRITSISRMETYADAPCYATLVFVNEEVQSQSDESTWLVRAETARELERLSTFLRSAWEEEFHIELTTDVLPSVTPTINSYITS